MERTYNLVPLLPGIYEFQVNNIDRETAEIFEEYIANGLGQEISGSPTPFMKVVPMEKEIPSHIEVFPYKKVSEIIKETDIIAVANCICRKEQKLIGKGCHAPTDNCLIFSHWTKFYIGNGLAKQITQEQALEILKSAEETGLMHCSGNTQLEHMAICNCCGCCCGVLRGITRLKNPQTVAKSDFILNINTDDCIGCGVCLITCPNEALSLERKAADEIGVPPKEFLDPMIKIGQEKGRI